MLCPQNGDPIVTIDSVTSLHRMYIAWRQRHIIGVNNLPKVVVRQRDGLESTVPDLSMWRPWAGSILFKGPYPPANAIIYMHVQFL